MSATMNIIKGLKPAAPKTLDEALDEADGTETTTSTAESFSDAEELVAGIEVEPVTDDQSEDFNDEAEPETVAVAVDPDSIELPKTKTAVAKLTAGEVVAVYVKGGFDIAGFEALSIDDQKSQLNIALFGKKGAKGVVAASKSGEVLAADPLASLALEIEGLKDQEAVEAAIDTAQEQEGLTDFRLGGLFARLKEIGTFGEFSTFQDYVLARFGVQYRKAMYQIAIYQGLTEASIPYDKVKNVGWTKLKELIPVLTTDNVDEWVAKAIAMNTDSLKQEVKHAMLPLGDSEDSEGSSLGSGAQTITSKTLKLHEDQKETWDLAISKAKELSGTDNDTAAAVFILTEFISNATGKKAVQKEVVVKEPTLTETFQAILDKAEGDVATALNELIGGPEFETVFPKVEFKEIVIAD